MNPPNSTSEENRSGQFQFARDAGNQVIPIPANEDLEGYLVYDRGNQDYAQVRFLKAEDLATRWAHKTAWKDFQDQDEFSIFPEMLALGLSRESPFYISELPSGEPVEGYLMRTGPLHLQAAVPLVLAFVESLSIHGLRFYQRFAFAPKSLWLEAIGAEPRLIFGEISPIIHNNAEAANAGLCLALLRNLSGHPRRNLHFQNLCRQIETGPQTLDAVENALKSYTRRNFPPNFRAGYKPPLPILQQILASPLVVTPNSSNLVNRPRHQEVDGSNGPFGTGMSYGF